MPQPVQPRTAVSCKGRCTAHSQLLTAITNCHGSRVGERHKLVCVYSLTDPLIPATPPVSLLCPNLSWGLTGPGWQMGSRGQPSVDSVERLSTRVLSKPPQLQLGSFLTWLGLTLRMETTHIPHLPGTNPKSGPKRTVYRRQELNLWWTHWPRLICLKPPKTAVSTYSIASTQLLQSGQV